MLVIAFVFAVLATSKDASHKDSFGAVDQTSSEWESGLRVHCVPRIAQGPDQLSEPNPAMAIGIGGGLIGFHPGSSSGRRVDGFESFVRCCNRWWRCNGQP